MGRYRENVLSEPMRMSLAVLLAASDEDMLVDAAELPGNTASTLKSLARRRLAVVEDDPGMDVRVLGPPLWRLTLRGLLEARRQGEGDGA